MAVLFDVVYNHAGGGFDDQSMYFLDRAKHTSNNESLYFTDQGWAGGLIFAYWQARVRQFLIDNARFLVEQYHVDGMRYDEVSVIDAYGGWEFCQELSSTIRVAKPNAIQIAEYWGASRWLAVTPTSEGMGFDAAWNDRLRLAVRHAIGAASTGSGATIGMQQIAESLSPPQNFSAAWRAVNSVEDHDVVFSGREQRIAAVGDGSDARSWWARSRARVATGIVLTAPGIPMLFMGQEILEDKQWNDNARFAPESLIWWDGLLAERTMRDQLAFTRDLIQLRLAQPALRGETLDVYHVREDTRVLAFHRWIPETGQDIVVVASLNDSTFGSYQLGFPSAGRWRELFNSDYYDTFPNPQVAGNGGSVFADGPAMHGLASSASVVIPANAVLVFGRE
jgi:1,4-alpha-glucan branching enzyme